MWPLLQNGNSDSYTVNKAMIHHLNNPRRPTDTAMSNYCSLPIVGCWIQAHALPRPVIVSS